MLVLNSIISISNGFNELLHPKEKLPFSSTSPE